MIPGGQPDPAGEIARGLIAALDRALDEPARAESLAAAMDAAHVLGLEGLARLLGELVTHAGAPWPGELAPAIERLGRLKGEAAARERIDPFVEADRALEALAAEISALEWSRAGDGSPAAATMRVDDVIERPPSAGPDEWARARAARLAIPVAAALRAALDWLGTDAGPLVPRRVALGESTLELAFAPPRPEGLHAAVEVIAAVEGSLGPTLDGREWAMRVPAWSERGCYLMILQGGVALAVPWHAVLRLALSGRPHGEGLAAPVVAPAPTGELPEGETPVLVVAHGRRRGAFAIERLVWRLPAAPVEPAGVPPLPGLTAQVRTEDGEHFWVAQPSWLLRSLPPERGGGRASASAALPTLTSADVERLEWPALDAPAAEQAHAPEPESAVGRPAEAAAPPVAPGPAASAGAAHPVAPPPAPVMAPAGARALVAEDSLTARMFLVRLLEQRGFAVEAVETAAALLSALARGGWALVFVDVDLPDGAGAPLLGAVRETSARNARTATLVALVRDPEDAEVAQRAGVGSLLFKPFEPDALDQLVAGLPGRGA